MRHLVAVGVLQASPAWAACVCVLGGEMGPFFLAFLSPEKRGGGCVWIWVEPDQSEKEEQH